MTDNGVIAVENTVPGFHFLRRASPPEDWQLHDPSEQDFDYAAGCTSTAGKGRRGSSSSAKFSNQLTAEKLATAVRF